MAVLYVYIEIGLALSWFARALMIKVNRSFPTYG
jgi:hypothetical protein